MRTQKFKTPEIPETVIQENIMRRLHEAKFLVVRFNGGGFNDGKGNYIRNYMVYAAKSLAGFPDLVAFRTLDGYRGRGAHVEALLIEVKKPGKTLTPTQEKFHALAARFGVKVHVLTDPKEVEELTE